MIEKKCKKCQRRLSIDSYYLDKSRVDGHYPNCKKCERTRKQEEAKSRKADPTWRARRARATKRWKSRHPERAAYLQRVQDLKGYGLSPDAYASLLARQEEVCAICQLPSKGLILEIDHDHDTGVIRGLLCSSCNIGLGQFKDDPHLIEKAIAYLEIHQKEFLS